MRSKRWIIGAIVAVILILAIAGSAYAVAGQKVPASQTTNTTCLGPTACPAADDATVCPRAAGEGACPRADGATVCPRTTGGCCGR